MAKAIYEKREFTNQQTGEVIKYEVYGIVALVNGERMELNLKSLTPAEKIAFQMVMTGEDIDETEYATSTRKATAEELTNHREKITKSTNENKTILDEDEDEESIFD